MSNLSKLEFALGEVVESADAIGLDLSDFAADFDNSVEEGLTVWAEECEKQWKDQAPWQTENLRESVASEVDTDNLQAWVGVDRDRLLSVAGEELPFQRRKYYYNQNGKVMTKDSQIMPDEDYVDIANANAVSAGGRNPAPGEGSPTPFIEEIWYAIADIVKERIFG